MFKNPFSFDGRIRRTEYCISFLIYVILATIIDAGIKEAPFLYILYLPGLWFFWAQGAKRCHDLGNNGFWQIIPLYAFWLMFDDGKPGINEYGSNPKYVNNFTSPNSPNSNSTSNTGYSGGYDGGHNSSNSNDILNSNENESEYKNGDLYK